MSEAYSRLYHRFAREFPAIYGDDRAFATWVRLLLLADASWPMRPPLPRSVRQKPLDQLREAGLVRVEGDQYSVLGLDAERTRRRDAARTGAAKRWQSEGDAAAMQSHSGRSASAMPRRDETSTRQDERDSPPPPAERGRRKNGTNPRSTESAPRQQGANPRAKGSSTRQVRADQKRGKTNLGAVLREAAQRNGDRPADADIESAEIKAWTP